MVAGMRTMLLVCLLAVGCGSTQITSRDLAFERDCQAAGKVPASSNMRDLCPRHAAEMAEKRAAAAAVEVDARRERDCYVLLEDPNATPQTRGECRQYLAGLAEQRAEARAASQRGATITAGALAAPKK